MADPLSNFESSQGDAKPRTPAEESVIKRRAAAIASLKALTPADYIFRSTAEAFAAALVISPPFFAFYTADGIVNARYPRVAIGQVPPSIPQTFPAMLGAGLRYGLGCTARSVVWVAGSHGLGTVLREHLQTGWRFESSPKDNPLFFLSGFASGAGMATLLTADWASAMGPVRRSGYVVFAGLVGALLPDLMLRAGPSARNALEQWKGSNMQ